MTTTVDCDWNELYCEEQDIVEALYHVVEMTMQQLAEASELDYTLCCSLIGRKEVTKRLADDAKRNRNSLITQGLCRYILRPGKTRSVLMVALTKKGRELYDSAPDA